MGAGPSNFNTHYRLTKVCQRTPLKGKGVPSKNLRGTCKIGLKIQGVSAYNFGGSGNSVTKLYHATCREAGVFKWGRLAH